MSVIVKGMSIPESCYYCGLTDTSFINCQAFSPCRLLEDDCEERRPEWCPLGEIKAPHGRLIDAGKLSDKMRGKWTVYDYEALGTMPTIIEAEGVDE